MSLQITAGSIDSALYRVHFQIQRIQDILALERTQNIAKYR